MAKFFRLVKNEYIKTLKKVSTKIMLVLIILGAFGVSGVTWLAGMTLNYVNEEYQTDFSEEIKWAKEAKEEGYEEDVKLYEYLNDNKIKPGSWQAMFAFSAQSALPAEELYAELDNVIASGDWKAACEFYLEHAATAGQKWEYQYRLDNDIAFTDEWQSSVITDVAVAKDTIENLGDEQSAERTQAEETEKLGLYRLENNISVNAADSESITDLIDNFDTNYWAIFFQSSSLVSLIGLLMIIIAGSSVSNEFSQGTIKFLLINPVKRWKILMSKYFMVITMGYLMLALLFLVMIPAAGIFTGFEGFSASYLYVSDGKVQDMSPFLQAAKLYLLNSVNVVVMATMAFALSSLFKSSALAIGAGVFSMMAGSTIVEILAMLKQDWARYLIFANTNLGDIYQGNSLFPQHSLTFAIIVIAVHMVVFLLTAWDGFTKREV